MCLVCRQTKASATAVCLFKLVAEIDAVVIPELDLAAIVHSVFHVDVESREGIQARDLRHARNVQCVEFTYETGLQLALLFARIARLLVAALAAFGQNA